MTVFVAATSLPTTEDLVHIRDLMTSAFPEGFSEEDWEHTLGGCHFFIRIPFRTGRRLCHGLAVRTFSGRGRDERHLV